MKKTIFATALAMSMFTSTLNAQGFSSQAMGGACPRPQAMGGACPRPQAMGTVGTMMSAVLVLFGIYL